MKWLRIASTLIACLLLVGLHSTSISAETKTSPANWSYLVDTSASLSLENVLHKQNQFEPISGNTLSFPSSTYVTWIRAEIASHSQPYWLWLLAPRAKHIDAYLLQSNTLQTQSDSDASQPTLKRELASRFDLLALPNDQQVRTVYLRLSSEHPLNIWFEVLDQSQLMHLEKPSYLYGALLGALLLLGLFNLIRYRLRRDSSCLWLIATALSLSLCSSANFGTLALFVPTWNVNQPLLADLSALGTIFSALMFTLSFAGHSPKAHPLLNRFLLINALLVLGYALMLCLFDASWHSTWLYLLVLLSTLNLLIISTVHWLSGYRPMRLIVVGCALFSVAYAWLLPALLGYQASNPINLLLSAFAFSTLATLMLSMAITARHQQQQRELIAERSEQAAHRAELRAKAEFLAKISHEIRTPMNGVLGMSELLLGTALSTKQRDYVQTIHSAGNELLSLINEILDISKLESGQIELDDVQFDLNALIEDCLAIYRAKAEQQKVELISFIQPQVPQVINGDPARLRQTLLALLSNAFKQTDEGEILLVAALDIKSTGYELRLTVQDSGRPLPLEQRQALLNTELNSGDFLNASRLGGRLELVIARQLIRLMGGDFGIQDSHYQGTTFWITLPLEQSRVAQTAHDLDSPLQGARLLVVDDNDTCRKVLNQQCSSWGLQVSCVSSGKEALALLRTKAHLHEYFDAVLLDQDMPGMTGMQLAAKIKEDPNLNHDILLIMLTGISNAPSKVIARNAGIKRILAKPVNGYTLKTTLADELSRRPNDTPSIAAPTPVSAPLQVPDDFKILVAEDNSISTKVIRGMLSKLNITPDTASNGQEALEALKRQHYDLVLMDCEMPILDGFSATLQLRQWEQEQQRPHTPVVALTAHIMDEHKVRARDAGMDGHMAKPVELSHLRELIEHWVKQREPNPQHD